MHDFSRRIRLYPSRRYYVSNSPSCQVFDRKNLRKTKAIGVLPPGRTRALFTVSSALARCGSREGNYPMRHGPPETGTSMAVPLKVQHTKKRHDLPAVS